MGGGTYEMMTIAKGSVGTEEDFLCLESGQSRTERFERGVRYGRKEEGADNGFVSIHRSRTKAVGKKRRCGQITPPPDNVYPGSHY